MGNLSHHRLAATVIAALATGFTCGAASGFESGAKGMLNAASRILGDYGLSFYDATEDPLGPDVIGIEVDTGRRTNTAYRVVVDRTGLVSGAGVSPFTVVVDRTGFANGAGVSPFAAVVVDRNELIMGADVSPFRVKLVGGSEEVTYVLGGGGALEVVEEPPIVVEAP